MGDGKYGEADRRKQRREDKRKLAEGMAPAPYLVPIKADNDEFSVFYDSRLRKYPTTGPASIS